MNEFKQRYAVLDKNSGKITNVTTYYDPELDYHLRAAGIIMGFGLAWYILPQDPILAKELYDAVKDTIGWPDRCPTQFTGLEGPGALSILGLLLAQEFDDQDAVIFLRSEMLRVSERKDCGDQEAGYYFFRDEQYPRGQLSALLASSHVLSKGQWHAFFNRTSEELKAQHGNPEVIDVDYPFLGLSEARCMNDKSGKFQMMLYIETYSATSHTNLLTTFQIIKLPNALNDVSIECDGVAYHDWKAISETSIEIATSCTTHTFQVSYGKTGGCL